MRPPPSPQVLVFGAAQLTGAEGPPEEAMPALVPQVRGGGPSDCLSSFDPTAARRPSPAPAPPLGPPPPPPGAGADGPAAKGGRWIERVCGVSGRAANGGRWIARVDGVSGRAAKGGRSMGRVHYISGRAAKAERAKFRGGWGGRQRPLDPAAYSGRKKGPQKVQRRRVALSPPPAVVRKGSDNGSDNAKEVGAGADDASAAEAGTALSVNGGVPAAQPSALQPELYR